MAVFTELSLEDASRVTRAHGLGACSGLVPIAAGSVNTNYFVDGAFGRRFFRIYEEQDASGVAYEWALLDHLVSAGVAVPHRVRGPGPGEERVAGKPTAIFERVGGEEVCQKLVTPGRAAAVGAELGRTHRALSSFGWRREGRFRRQDLRDRLDRAATHGRPELVEPIGRLREVLDELDANEPEDLARGVVHGDLFRDNVRFEGERIVALLDWESASDGVLAYDLMVTVLAWCFGDRFDWELARAMVQAYDRERPLGEVEWSSLRHLGMAAAARFATTRITDFHLRSGGVGERVHKDYRRFLARLEAVAAQDGGTLARMLGAR